MTTAGDDVEPRIDRLLLLRMSSEPRYVPGQIRMVSPAWLASIAA